jgi:hypothetical protein
VVVNTSKIDLHEIELRLNPLYFEISLLKFRVGEASPEVRAKYRELISNLSDQYNCIESLVRNLRETENKVPDEQIKLAQQNLQELQKTFAMAGQLISIETANQVCAFY